MSPCIDEIGQSVNYLNMRTPSAIVGELHMTGPIQTNKVKKSLEIFDYFHTPDREKLAKEFKKYSERLSKKKF